MGIEGFVDARAAIGVLVSLAYMSLSVAVTPFGLVILLVLGMLALAFLPLAVAVALAATLAIGSGRVKSNRLDLWTSECQTKPGFHRMQ